METQENGKAASLAASLGSAPSPRICAQWTVELNCDCPKCGESVNLLDYPDFWDGRKLEIPERAKGVEVACPECDHQFEVDTEY